LTSCCGRRMCPLLVWRSWRWASQLFLVCFSLFLLCSGSFLLFVRRVALHGWRSDVRPHVSAASCSAAGAPARAPAPRAGTPVVRARAPASCDSLSLFGVGFAAVAAVLLLACLLLHGRLHVLVLGHRLRVFLCLCLGWFFAAVAAVLVLVHPLLHGRLHSLVLGHRPRVCLCLCLGWFLRLLLPCSCSCIRCFMGSCTCSSSGTGCGCFSDFVWGGF